MSIPASCRSEFGTHGRLIPAVAGQGPDHMAFDALLLEQCQTTNDPGPVLRFYLWEGSWLSLGRHQTPRSNQWLDLVRNGRLKMVRRPSGGGAVLHGGGLTYALIWPHPPRQRREAYRRVNAWISSGLARLGLELHPGMIQPSLEAKIASPAPPRQISWIRWGINALAVPSFGKGATSCSTVKSPWRRPDSFGKTSLEQLHLAGSPQHRLLPVLKQLLPRRLRSSGQNSAGA